MTAQRPCAPPTPTRTGLIRLAAAGLAIALTGGLAFMPSAPLSAAQDGAAAPSSVTFPSGTSPTEGPEGNRARLDRSAYRTGAQGDNAPPFQGEFELSCWQEGKKIIDGANVSAPIAGGLTERDSAYFGQKSGTARILIMRGENLCLASRP